MKLARILIALFALASFLPAQPAHKKEAAKKEMAKKEMAKKEMAAAAGPIDINTANAGYRFQRGGIGRVDVDGSSGGGHFLLGGFLLVRRLGGQEGREGKQRDENSG